MKNYSSFTNSIFGSVRVVKDEDGTVWFCGKDVCDCLKHSNSRRAIGMHCNDVTKYYPILDLMGRPQNMTFITEADVYRLVIHSRLPRAREFEKWVMEEVLPSIRKTGSYEMPTSVNDPRYDNINRIYDMVNNKFNGVPTLYNVARILNTSMPILMDALRWAECIDMEGNLNPNIESRWCKENRNKDGDIILAFTPEAIQEIKSILNIYMVIYSYNIPSYVKISDRDYAEMNFIMPNNL